MNNLQIQQSERERERERGGEGGREGGREGEREIVSDTCLLECLTAKLTTLSFSTLFWQPAEQALKYITLLLPHTGS